MLNRFKARLVAQGFSQVSGIDFEETFLSTVRLESLRTFLAIEAYLNYKIYQTNMVSAYPQSVLYAEVFIKALKEFEILLKKCL